MRARRTVGPYAVGQRVDMIPGVPKGFEVYATAKRMYGLPVLEVHADYYFSIDGRWSAFKGSRAEGWIVKNERNFMEYSDPIFNKKEALQEMVAAASRK